MYRFKKELLGKISHLLKIFLKYCPINEEINIQFERAMNTPNNNSGNSNQPMQLFNQ
jgi:hypothetical protein